MNEKLFKWIQQDDSCHVNQDLSITSYHDPDHQEEMEFIIERIKSLYAAGGAIESFTAVDTNNTVINIDCSEDSIDIVQPKSDAVYMFDNYFHPTWLRWQSSHLSNHDVQADGWIRADNLADHIREMDDEWYLWADCEGWVDERVKNTIKELKEMLYDDDLPQSYLMLEFLDQVITAIRINKSQEDQ